MQKAVLTAGTVSLHFTAIAQHGTAGGSPAFTGRYCRAIIVGYAQKNLQSGSTLTGSTFSPVGGGDTAIQDIKQQGENINTGDVNIQTLEAYGRTLATYIYYGEEEYDDGSIAGWYTDDGLADVTFTAGQGLWVAAPDAETTIRFPAPEL